jgi:hypothetical protein
MASIDQSRVVCWGPLPTLRHGSSVGKPWRTCGQHGAHVTAQKFNSKDPEALATWIQSLGQMLAKAVKVEDQAGLPIELTAEAKARHQGMIRHALVLTPVPEAMEGRVNSSEILRWLPNADCSESVIVEIFERYGTGQVTPMAHKQMMDALKAAVSVTPVGLRLIEGQAHALVRRLTCEHHRSLGWMDHEGFIRSSRFHVRLSLNRFQMPWMEADPTDPLWPPERRHLIARLGWMTCHFSIGDLRTLKWKT